MTQERRLPPGPRGLPVFGYLPYLKKEGGFARIAEKYGRETKSDIVCVDVGFLKMVIINKYEDIIDVFVKREECACRSSNNVFAMLVDGYKGILFANGEYSKERREFAMSVLRDSGICKNVVERTSTEERVYLLKALEDTEERPINPKEILMAATTNVVSHLMFGKRFDYDDEELAMLRQSIISATMGNNRSIFFKQWMRWIPAFLDVLGVQTVERDLRRLLSYIDGKIAEHETTLDPDHPRDYIDAYLLRKKEAPESFTEMQLGCEIIDMFFASGENLPGTLLWAFLYMAKFPKVQAKVQSELDEKIDGDRLPTIADKSKLPYTDAVFMEIQRKATVTPFGARHMSDTEDLLIGDYLIPKGWTFGPNIYAVHHDPETWPDPHNFNPDNFLDETTGKFRNVDRLIPFGIGRRSCVGSSLATSVVFLILTGCLKRFTIESTNPKELDGPPVGYIELPSPYHVCFRNRKK